MQAILRSPDRQFAHSPDGTITVVRLFLVTAATLICFSANSLLTRGALGADRIDWASFTLIRLATGAATLALLVRLRTTAGAPQPGAPYDEAGQRGSWIGAAALAAYAVAFTYAYTRIGAAIGALLLFGAVQVTMIGTGLARGERPARTDWIGMLLALGGLLVLTLPGATAPDSIGAALMIAAGIAWGVYSLAGRGSRDPLAATAGNFIRGTLLVALAVVWVIGASTMAADGVLLATASGSIASGVGYTLWYTALPLLAAWRAAVVQLVVPVLTALLAALLLGEPIEARLVAATLLVAAGVLLTSGIVARRP
jgi:drug/metabolite transporter (DMT)-like permease